MVAFEHRTGMFEVHGVVGACGPREGKDPLEPAAGYRGVGGHRGAALELPHFAMGPRGDSRRQSALGDLLGQCFQLVAVLLPQLLVDGA